jgi:hypothetical protein
MDVEFFYSLTSAHSSWNYERTPLNRKYRIHTATCFLGL